MKTLKQIAKGKGEKATQAKEMIKLNEEADNEGMKITKEKFNEYLGIRDSGATNMWNVSMVVELAATLTKKDCLDIMKNFDKYVANWGNGKRK